jgi:hypothetical protein
LRPITTWRSRGRIEKRLFSSGGLDVRAKMGKWKAVLSRDFYKFTIISHSCHGLLSIIAHMEPFDDRGFGPSP